MLHAVFHAGPSTTMHWFDTAGEGSALRAGTRPGGNSANGNAVMFDTGKILACGGSEAFAKPQFPSTTEASLITIGKANTQAQVSGSLIHACEILRPPMNPANMLTTSYYGL